MSDDYWKAPRDELVYRLEATIGYRDEARALAERYREALEAIEAVRPAPDVTSDWELYQSIAVQCKQLARSALLVEHDSSSETTTGAAVDASNTVAIVVHKENGRTITYEVSRERIRTEHNEEETP